MEEQTRQAIDTCLAAHYSLMGNPRFWYDKGLQDASMLFCVIASDLRATGTTRDLRKLIGR